MCVLLFFEKIKQNKMKLRRTSHMVRCLEWSNSHSFSSLPFNANPENTSAKIMSDNSKKRLRLRLRLRYIPILTDAVDDLFFVHFVFSCFSLSVRRTRVMLI